MYGRMGCTSTFAWAKTSNWLASFWSVSCLMAKEVIALEDGYRESTESWLSLLRDLERRGMPAPKLATGDGALGCWAALRQVYPETEEQRCWVHKIANVLDKLPKRVQP
jgi:putative transposase